LLGFTAICWADKTQGSDVLGTGIVVVAVHGPYRFGDVVAWVGYGQLAAMAASVCKVFANIAAGSG
jgi:hypothetical protein